MKKSASRKVVNSIGVGILTAMTTCTNVYASYDAIPETDAAKGDNTQTEEAAAGGTESIGMVLTADATAPVVSQEEEAQQMLEKAAAALDVAQSPKIEGGGQTEDGQDAVAEAPEDIKEDLKNSQNAVKEIENSVGQLEELNKNAEAEKQEYTDAVTDEDGILDKVAANVPAAAESVEKADKAVDAAKEVVADKAEKVEQAQGTVYDNSAAAAAAEKQAQEDLKEAEEALQDAQKANDEAAEQVQMAETALDLLKDQKEKAETALKDAQDAAAEAERALNAILAEIEGDEYTGNAQTALEKAKAAYEKAVADKIAAEAEVQAADEAVAEAKTKLDEANFELAAATEELQKAEGLKSEAQKTLETVEANYAEAEKQKAELETQQSTLQKEISEKEEDIANYEKELEDYTTANKAQLDLIDAIDQMQEEISQIPKDDPSFQEKALKLAEEMIKYHTVANGIEEKIYFSTYHVDGKNPDKEYIMVQYADKSDPDQKTIQSVKCYAYEVGEDGKITLFEKKATCYKAFVEDEKGNQYEFKVEIPNGDIKKVKITTIYPDGSQYVDPSNYDLNRLTYWGTNKTNGETGWKLNKYTVRAQTRPNPWRPWPEIPLKLDYWEYDFMPGKKQYEPPFLYPQFEEEDGTPM